MSNAPKNVESFLQEQVNNGNFGTVYEAEVAFQHELARRQIDRAIEQGELQVAEGNFRTMSTESNQQFMSALRQKLLS